MNWIKHIMRIILKQNYHITQHNSAHCYSEKQYVVQQPTILVKIYTNLRRTDLVFRII